ncbi:hypothetical protein J3459_010041 [Metarhizium acridum]|nr:hypothetical protein J3459_010066 [Metarhizium acridum]KAG8422790.1 hypothetical protein J3459_010041 [Metarhizium acridum]
MHRVLTDVVLDFAKMGALTHPVLLHPNMVRPFQLGDSLLSQANCGSPFSRSMILISMVIYVLVGIEIVKRRGALQSFNSDPVPLEDSIASTADTPCNKPESRVTEENAQSRHGHAPVSYSGEESPILTPKPSIRTFHTVATPTRHLSISFRQYILMPMFFFLALLSVWVAPSTNRVGAFVNPDFLSYPLLLSVGATGSLRGFWNGVIFITIGMKSQRRRDDLERRATHR